ncbi:MAG: tRNA (guanosine(37)-N1)-methyltransferase TrmD [Deltaproteobacteria bacterium RIFCSPLOWO2_02_FULL_46_8]|nr:MAG: tRNA (guanosine(37)-N1)-methyltransferase TrmD [Deltaproteobacteria bacterium RIFCSPLOWO2_02_FULL_46_8]
MHFEILTIFPEFFESCFEVSLLGKALTSGKIKVNLHNFRDCATDKHHRVDDIPYGGGAGMVLKPEPLVKALDAIPKEKNSRIILLTPRGKLFHQQMAQEWSQLDQLILICGRYEGVDERVVELRVDEEVSIGDYILNGGEIAAAVVLETVVRLLPGVLGNEASISQESFQQGLLEYPQYTRPPEFEGLKVPDVLLSGHHKEIESWRHKEAIRITRERRPDLLNKKK